MSYVLTMLLAPFGAAVLMATPVAAECDNYGNQVNVGSDYDCTVNQNYCDGESGPAGSGAGAGAGAGAGGQSGASAGASAGSSTSCDQCAGDQCSTNSTSPGGGVGDKVPDLIDGGLPCAWSIGVAADSTFWASPCDRPEFDPCKIGLALNTDSDTFVQHANLCQWQLVLSN